MELRVIRARNVNDALATGLRHLSVNGEREESRVGEVIASPCPVITVYQKPWERVLFSPMRDANPFFHVFESLWMLGGRRDVEFVKRYNQRFTQYSDDGEIVHGAYGYRWRNWFGMDQLQLLAEMLKKDPSTRRAVLTMWDPTSDLAGSGVDLPCNTHVYFRVHKNELQMTVLCRSNDIIWGAYGANAVHMSFLQEFLATLIGVQMGEYIQFSNNYHIYTDVVPSTEFSIRADNAEKNDYYKRRENVADPILSHALLKDPSSWEKELERFLSDPCEVGHCKNSFLSDVAAPMAIVWEAWKRKDFNAALTSCESIASEDWQIACFEWIERRKIKAEDAK